MRLSRASKSLATVAVLVTVGACSPASQQDAASEATESPVVATVNGTAINQAAVDFIAKQAVGAGRPDTPQSRAAIIDQLTMQVVLAEEAIKKGLDKGSVVTQQLALIKQSVLANAYVEDFLASNAVTEAMLKAEYERIKATITGNEYKARHILVEAESEAKAIIAQLKKDPAAFEKLAKEKSTDQGSKDAGGELGWFDLNGMVPEFGAATSQLKKGEISEAPVKTQYGYHIIQLEDSKPIEAPPIEEVTPQLTQQLQQQSMKTHLDALKATAKIEVVGAPAPAPAADSSPAG